MEKWNSNISSVALCCAVKAMWPVGRDNLRGYVDEQTFLDPGARCSTLVELLRWRAQHQPGRRAYAFLVDGETKEVHLTHQKLDRQARAIAAKLQSLAAPSGRALLLYPPGLEYIAGLRSCLARCRG